MGNWKKIKNNSDLEGKIVLVKTDNKYPRNEYYEPYWSEENERWEFI